MCLLADVVILFSDALHLKSVRTNEVKKTIEHKKCTKMGQKDKDGESLKLPGKLSDDTDDDGGHVIDSSTNSASSSEKMSKRVKSVSRNRFEDIDLVRNTWHIFGKK